jgi:hypothetical protein
MKVDVFLSYSRRDEQKALAIAGFLKEQGLRCWIDRAALRLAEGFDERISKAIRDCSVVLWLASKNSLESDYVRYEIAAAVSQGKTIGPIFLEELDRNELTPPFSLVSTRVQGIEYFKGSVEENLAKLLGDLRPLTRPRKLARIALSVLLFIVVAVVAGLVFHVVDNSRLAQDLPADAAALPAADILSIAYTDAPPAAPAPLTPPKFQFAILAKRHNETAFTLLNDGETLASKVDLYVIIVRPLSAGFLYVFQVDTLGRNEWLFPRNVSSQYSTGANPVGLGQVIQIPPPEKGELYLDATTGVEHVYAVLAATRWPELETALSERESGSLALQKLKQDVRVQKPLSLRFAGSVEFV